MQASSDFLKGIKASGKVGEKFFDLVKENSEQSALEEKTKHLSYISVLCALNMVDGLSFHIDLAKKAGATFEEIKSAALVGLPVAGLNVFKALANVIEVIEKNN